MASINESFNIDDLLDDLNFATTSTTTCPTGQSHQNSSSFPSSNSAVILSRDSAASDASTTMTRHLPHPPQDCRNQLNPKTKFAVSKASADNDDSKLSLDQWIDTLKADTSPSPPKVGRFQPSLSFFQSSSQHLAFSPEEAKKTSNQMFAQFGLATALSPVLNQQTTKEGLWDSSWDESSPVVSAASSRQTQNAQTGASNTHDSANNNNHMLGSAMTQKSNKPQHSSLPAVVSHSLSPQQSSSAPSANTQKSRCCRVVVAGPSTPRGQKNSTFSKVACDNLLCSQCNFKVLCFPDCKWAASCDYLYFRNNMPNVDKLQKQLLPSSSAEAAYCCQCSWLSISKERSLVYGVQGDPQWICAGHTCTLIT